MSDLLLFMIFFRYKFPPPPCLVRNFSFNQFTKNVARMVDVVEVNLHL